MAIAAGATWPNNLDQYFLNNYQNIVVIMSDEWTITMKNLSNILSAGSNPARDKHARNASAIFGVVLTAASRRADPPYRTSNQSLKKCFGINYECEQGRESNH